MKSFLRSFTLILGLIVFLSGCKKDNISADNLDKIFPQSSFTFIDDQISTGYKIQRAEGEGVVVLSNSAGIAPNQIQLTRFDEDLNMIWSKLYSEGSKIDRGNDLLLTSDGGYMICGYTLNLGAGSQDVYLLKVDADGEKQWSRAFGDMDSETGFSVLEISSGGYIVIGKTDISTSALETLVLVIRLDENGEFIWQRMMRRNFSNSGWSVLETGTDELVISGLLSGDVDGNGIFFAKMDMDGHIFGEKLIEQEGIVPIAQDLIRTTDGGFAIAVSASIASITDPPKILLFKLNEMGELQWSKTYGGKGTDYVHAFLQNNEGEFVMVGRSSSFNTAGLSMYIVKTTETGDVIWQNLYGSDALTGAWDLLPLEEGGYMVSGSLTSSIGSAVDFKLVLLQIDEQGIPQ